MTSFRKNTFLTDILLILLKEKRLFGRLFALSLFFSLFVCLGVIYWSTPMYLNYGVLKVELDKDNKAHKYLINIASGSDRNQQAISLLQARSLMTYVVEETNANVRYSVRKLLKDREISNPPFQLRCENQLKAIYYLEFSSDSDIMISDGKNSSKNIMFDQRFLFQDNEFCLSLITDQLPEELTGQKIKVEISPADAYANNILNNVSIQPVGKSSDMLAIKMAGENPEKNAYLINTLMECYINNGINSKSQSLSNSREWIKGRIDTLASELKRLEVQIENKKIQQKTLNKPMEADLHMHNVLRLEDNMYSNDVQIQQIENLVEILSDTIDIWHEIPNSISHNYISKDIDFFNEGLMKLKKMDNNPESNNPVTKTLKLSLNALRKSIRNNVDKLYESYLVEQGELLSRKSSIYSKIEEYSSNIKDETELMRVRRVKRALYRYLTRKYETTLLTIQRVRPEARVIEYSEIPERPFSPPRKKILLTGLIFSFGVTALPLLWKLFIVQTVDGIDDVSRVIKAPILGVIPSKPKVAQEKELVVMWESHDPITEAFRMVRVNMDFINSGKNQVIATSSTIPGEGKSYVSINLSTTLTMGNKKVCMVDLDLRRRSLSMSMGVKKMSGATEFLTSKTENLDKLLVKTDFNDNLYILPAGKMPPNPAELLTTGRYDELINELRSRFDYVMIDNPPLNIVADGKIANRAVDLTCYIIRAGKLDKRELPFIQEVYEEKQLNNFSVIITDVPDERNRLFI